MLRERYECPHFRILIIGRANAGKTTILEKVCGVAKGTKPIVYNMNGMQTKTYASTNIQNLLGKKLQHSQTYLMSSIEVK